MIGEMCPACGAGEAHMRIIKIGGATFISLQSIHDEDVPANDIGAAFIVACGGCGAVFMRGEEAKNET